MPGRHTWHGRFSLAAIFTSEDLTNVKNALVEAALRGYASCTVNGERHDNASLEELQNLLKFIQADLADDATATGSQGGMRIRRLVPGGCG